MILKVATYSEYDMFSCRLTSVVFRGATSGKFTTFLPCAWNIILFERSILEMTEKQSESTVGWQRHRMASCSCVFVS